MVYGHFLDSNVPLPIVGWAASYGGTRIEFELTVHSHSELLSLIRQRSICQRGRKGRPESVFLNDEGNLCILIGESIAFILARGRDKIQCRTEPGYDTEALAYLLLNLVLPIYLETEGRLALLHASAVALGEQAIAFLGDCTTGKSTLAEYFLSRGCALVADDRLAISRGEQGVLAVPSHPYMRVGPKSPLWLGEPVEKACHDALPVRKVYVLEPSAPGTEPRVEVVSASDASWELMRCRMVWFRDGVVDGFRLFADMAVSRMVSRLYVPRSMAALPAVYELVIRDV